LIPATIHLLRMPDGEPVLKFTMTVKGFRRLPELQNFLLNVLHFTPGADETPFIDTARAT